MKTILHISADFPDPLVPEKTRAVENLIAGAQGFRHLVYSMNRVSWRQDIALFSFAEDRTAIAYGAPPYGFRLAHYLSQVAETIRADLEQKRLMPDLIHAHKFSVEGLIAGELAEKTGIPFAASLWGDTDIKIFEAKKNLRSRYKKIAGDAAILLPPAPWTREYFEQAFSLDASHFELLPVMTAGEAIIAPQSVDAPRLVSVFALDSWRRKGLDTLAQAVTLLSKNIPAIALDVYGRGNPRSLLEAKEAIRMAGAENRVRLMGPLSHDKVQSTINRYAAFVMAPRRETFGMVHVEAVLAGVPILWSKGRGIDGLFEGFQIGCGCDPKSVAEVADGMRFLIENERPLKASIRRRQSDDSFHALRSDGISERYTALLSRLTGNPEPRVSSFRSRHMPRVS
jgi:glycosyltransferase involved in cell wall biosynthesis